MFTDLFRAWSPRAVTPPVRPEPAVTGEPAFAARARLTQLRDTLQAEARKPKPHTSRRGEPPVFFFNAARQAEYEASCPPAAPAAPSPIARLIANELPALMGSGDVRQVARTISGLREAAALLAPSVAPAKELADLLAVPDDEAILVLHPEERAGFRLLVRGIADAAQFQLLMLDAVTGDAAEGLLPGPRLPNRFRIASGDPDPTIPAGVPMVVEGRYQLFQPTAVRSDGSVPEAFRGCDHWLWGKTPLAAVRRVDGERVVVLGRPAFRTTWEVERRFPAMAAEAQLIQVLSPFQVAERLGRLAGRPVPVRNVAEEPARKLARAA